MAEGNVPAPTRTDDQLVPIKARLPIRKRNLLMDLQKKQKNPIFLISLDILQNTNFFGAFTTFANVPSIYIQQFLNTLTVDTKTGIYSFYWRFGYRFVNNLGYPEELQFVSTMYVNSLYQPWRSILSMINQCLTGKTSGFDIPRHPVIQMMWGVVTGTNVDYAELIWEEFDQAIKTLFSDTASLKVPSKKPKPHVIPYYDYTLGNLKFVPKGELNEVFYMAIPNDLLTYAIRNAKYYPKYLEMATCKPRQPTAVTDEESVKKKKVPPTDKSKKPAPAKQTKLMKEKSTKPTPSTKASKGKVLKVQKGKRPDRLVDQEDEEPQPVLEPQ
ncbi:hypothetical protein Tco_1369138 [Tanacetum coccineum]